MNPGINAAVGRVCQVCGSPRLVRFGDIPGGTVYRCRGCGSKELYPARVSEAADPCSFGEAYRNAYDSKKALAVFEFFRHRQPPAPVGSASLLDIGCGDGSFLAAARHAGWIVFGLDTDPIAINHLKARGISGIVGTLGEATPQTRSYDVITLWDLLEHVADLVAAMRWLSKAVRPDGWIHVLTPDGGSVFDRLARARNLLPFGSRGRLLQLCLNRYHRHRFTKCGLESLFARFGFETKAVSSVQVFSLQPDVYLDGFAPGIDAWTASRSVNRATSRLAYSLLRALRIKNKILYSGKRLQSAESDPNGP